MNYRSLKGEARRLQSWPRVEGSGCRGRGRWLERGREIRNENHMEGTFEPGMKRRGRRGELGEGEAEEERGRRGGGRYSDWGCFAPPIREAPLGNGDRTGLVVGRDGGDGQVVGRARSLWIDFSLDEVRQPGAKRRVVLHTMGVWREPRRRREGGGKQMYVCEGGVWEFFGGTSQSNGSTILQNAARASRKQRSPVKSAPLSNPARARCC